MSIHLKNQKKNQKKLSFNSTDRLLPFIFFSIPLTRTRTYFWRLYKSRRSYDSNSTQQLCTVQWAFALVCIFHIFIFLRYFHAVREHRYQQWNQKAVFIHTFRCISQNSKNKNCCKGLALQNKNMQFQWPCCWGWTVSPALEIQSTHYIRTDLPSLLLLLLLSIIDCTRKTLLCSV